MYVGYRDPMVSASSADLGFRILGFSVQNVFGSPRAHSHFPRSQLGWLPAGGRGDPVTLFGVPWSFLTLDGLHHLFPARAQISPVQARLDDPPRRGRHARGDADPTRSVCRASRIRVEILSRHVLRPDRDPARHGVRIGMSSTLAFAVVTETIFSWPGIGKLIIDSIASLDRPVMVAYLMLVAFLFIMINFLVDIAYAALDPRMRVRRA